jgi:hypothetical protein
MKPLPLNKRALALDLPLFDRAHRSAGWRQQAEGDPDYMTVVWLNVAWYEAAVRTADDSNRAYYEECLESAKRLAGI